MGESVAKPLSYYDNNLTGTLHLLDAMKRHGCNIIGACDHSHSHSHRQCLKQ